MLLSAFLGALVGAILGLTGAGGGILAVPMLSVGMGWTMQQAAPVALIAVSISAAVGALDGLRHGLVRYKAAALIAISGFPLVYLGQTIAHHLPQAFLQMSFAGVMLLIAYRLYRQGRSPLHTDAEMSLAVARVHPDSGKFIWSMRSAALLASIGGLTGLTTGLLGVGGGFLIVPMLRKFTDVSMQGVVATSLLVIALVGASGVGSAVLRQSGIPWGPAAIFTATTVCGMLAGRKVIKTISPGQVQAGFSMVLTLVALRLLFGAAMTLLGKLA